MKKKSTFAEKKRQTQMNHWNLTEENPFIVSTDVFQELETIYTKITDAFIFLCLEGNANVEVDLQKYALTRNTQLVLLTGMTLRMTDMSDDFRLLYIGCSDSLFREIVNNLEPHFFHFLRDNPYVVLAEEEADYLKNMSHFIRRAYGEEYYRRQMGRNYIQNLFLYFYNRTQHAASLSNGKWVDRKEELFRHFVQLVHRHCVTRRDVGFYAQKLNITSRYLSSVVQAVSGETTKDIIDRHVIVEMKILLKNTNLTIQEISNRMKFADQSFFGRYFKKHTGMSPLQYRATSDG